MPTTKTMTKPKSHRASANRTKGSGDYTEWSKEELLEKARDAGIKGRSSMNKDELINALKK